MSKMKDLEVHILDAIEETYWDLSVDTPQKFSEGLRNRLEQKGVDWWEHRNHIARKVREINEY